MPVLEVVTHKHDTKKIILAVEVIGTTLLWGTEQHEHSLHHYAGHFLCFKPCGRREEFEYGSR
jgi:hypothetical protein